MLIVIVRFLAFFAMLGSHPFHVSVCELDHNSKTNTIDISMKLFIDDFQLALQKQGHQDLFIDDETDQELLSAYLKEKFVLSIDGRQLNWVFLGFELIDEEIKCYLQVKDIVTIASITVENNTLTEHIPDQVNLHHFDYKGTTKSFRTSSAKPSETIETSSW
ncbi:MAG: hypothetical protein HC819_18850 [Cyclobacteriaceae bacterium]|nr:hypothetical protein [Cyclobacteriaceae bacterium]